MRRLALVAVGLALALPSVATGSSAFTPNDPLVPKQWYLGAIHAFDFWPDAAPVLAPVRVAIVDSGIDEDHPEFAGKIAAVQSFVKGGVTDRQGHGTFIAGLIAATADNGSGIAGIAPPAELLIAKVVRSDGTIEPEAEARAIRWAADNGARVINLSLGGLRDPHHRERDTYSEAEARAIEYAYSKGAVLVAAVGNADEAPKSPWQYASYPAALPHVLGVSAVAQDGFAPSFSNRDKLYNDLAAPGVGIISTLPRAITAARPSCADQGYSICGPPEFRVADGTSYAAAQVSAAAALLIASRPSLSPAQVMTLLERSAVKAAEPRRDQYTGWGRLDIAAALRALAGPVPSPDRYEGNDQAGDQAFTVYGRTIELKATLDYWDDNVDVYRTRLKAGQTVSVSVEGPVGTDTNLMLWRPGTKVVETQSLAGQIVIQSQRVTQSSRNGPNERFLHRATVGGWYYVEVKMATPGSGRYHLRITKSHV